MASNSESPTRSRSRHKQQRNENMEVETNTKEDALERSIEEIRSKMKEKRRKKVQADLSHSRSRHKNANLVLKATLRQNNRTLAKSLEVSRNEHRHAQNDLVELQRERHMLQSIVNRFQGQHDKQRSQIKGVHEVLRKVTSSLMDTVGLLGQAMDMCVIPRHTKDRSLGLIFRTSSLTSDDLSDSETKEDRRSASAETSAPNLSSIPRRIPANKDILNQSTVKNNPEEEIEDLPDIDVPLCFMSDKKAPQGKERTRRDTRNISAENQKLSRRTSSLLNPATMAAVATEIEKSVENIRTVLEETGDDGEGSNKKQAPICIDDEETTQDVEMDEVESDGQSPDRRVTKKRSGRLSLRKESVASEHGHGEVDEETEDVSSVSKDDAGKRRSGRLSNKRRTYVYPDDDDEDESKEKGDCMELVPEDEEIIESSSDRRGSRERSRRLSRNRGTFVKEGDDLKTFGTEDDLMEIEILDDDDDEANDGSKVGNLNQQEDNVEEAEAELQQQHKSDTIEPDEGATVIIAQSGEKTRKKSKKKKKDKKAKKINKEKNRDLARESAGEHAVVGESKDDQNEEKVLLCTIPDDRCERVKDGNSAEKSDYRIVDMELTTAAGGHISVIEGADSQTKSNENNVTGSTEGSQGSKLGSPSGDGDTSQKTQRSADPCKEKPKSRLPVLMKGKSKTSKLKKSMHKSQSRMGTNKDSIRRRDEKDIQQMTVFDLSIGDSFSHPTPSRLISKPGAATESNPDEAVNEDNKFHQPTTGRGSEDGLQKIAQTESSHDAEAEDDFSNQEFDTRGKNKKISREEKHGKIKRKSRKSKSVVTPEAAEPKVRLAEKALLEELGNIDASYLSDVTNPERKSKIGASLTSRKSSLKDGGESLNDLMLKPHHRKSSKRKLSKKSFYFGDDDSVEDPRQSRVDRKSEVRTGELNTSALNASSLNLDNPKPDSASLLPKTSSSSSNTTTDILEDLENVLLEVDEPKARASNKTQRRTTILKHSGQSSKGDSKLNVTFNHDDICDFEEVKKDKVSKTTQNSEIGTTRISKSKDQKQTSRKTFVVLNDIAKTFFGNFDDFKSKDENEVDGEVESVISETQISKESENPSSSGGSRMGDDDVLEALGTSSGMSQVDQPDKPEATKNKKVVEQKNKRKVKSGYTDTMDIMNVDIVAKQASKHMTEPVQPSRLDDVSRSANEDEVLDRSTSNTQNNQPDESEPTCSRREEEKDEAKVQKTNKRKTMADDDDVLDDNPSKVARAHVESVPEVPERRGRRSKAVSYKEPSINSKLRQGDPNTFTVYKGLPGKTSKKDKSRAPLGNITN
eukprot:XP_011660887.1 PREDICTED: uncharacterized protein LOC580611 isoform X2 [Strongylocentrotus purpuratus]